MPDPIRPESFAIAASVDWTGGMISASMNGSGIDYIWATAACKAVPIRADTSTATCRMIDDLNESLAPRDDYEFLKMRVASEFITRLIDAGGPEGFVAEVSDCFILLSIIGAPGTYAVRLRNENDADFSPWIAIGQPQAVTDPYASSLFRARFVAKDHFEVPWILSPGSGEKNVIAEVLTFFGRSESMSLRIVANYEMPRYSMSVKMRVSYLPAESEGDAEPTVVVVDPPSYNGYPVVSKRALIMPSGLAATPSDVDALDVGVPAEVKAIVVRFRFASPRRMSRISELLAQGLMQSAAEGSSFEAVLITRGIQEFRSPLAPVDLNSGVYEAEFSPIESDGVLVSDGIAAFYPSIPSECIQGSLVSLDVEGIDFAGLGDNISTPDSDGVPTYRGYSDPDDRRNAFGDYSFWSKS